MAAREMTTSRGSGSTGSRQVARYAWEVLRWPVVAGAAVIAFVLGFVGYREYLVEQGAAHSVLDTLYLDLRLFTVEWTAFGGEVPWELDVARWLAPAVALAAVIKAVGYIFRDQIRLFRLGFSKGHVIVAGAGQKGLLLARSLLADGHRVAVIERDTSSPLLESCRAEGAIAVVGDARDAVVLKRAGVDGARHLLVVCGDPSTNVEVVATAFDLVSSRSGTPLTCIAHIPDARLCRLLRAHQVGAVREVPFRLDFFNVFETGARALLHEYPVVAEVGDQRDTHIIVVGLSLLGQAVITRAARQWRIEQRGEGETERSLLHVTVVDRDANNIIRALTTRYPGLETSTSIDCHDVDPESPEFEHVAFLPPERGDERLAAVLVCIDGDAAALSAGLVLHQHLSRRNVPIIVVSTTDGGLTSLSTNADDDVQFNTLHAFRLLNRSCVPEVVLGGTYELLAQAMHEEYLHHGALEGQTATTNPSLVPWDVLPDVLKESNRYQASHIGTKLTAVGCELRPLDDWDSELFTFTTEEVEMLAEMEHERWVADRVRAGWTQGPGGPDTLLKTTPYLVDWDDLSETIKERDRIFVRGLPRFLADAGFEICRIEKTAQQSAPNGFAELLGAAPSLGEIVDAHPQSRSDPVPH